MNIMEMGETDLNNSETIQSQNQLTDDDISYLIQNNVYIGSDGTFWTTSPNNDDAIIADINPILSNPKLDFLCNTLQMNVNTANLSDEDVSRWYKIMKRNILQLIQRLGDLNTFGKRYQKVLATQLCSKFCLNCLLIIYE